MRGGQRLSHRLGQRDCHWGLYDGTNRIIIVLFGVLNVDAMHRVYSEFYSRQQFRRIYQGINHAKRKRGVGGVPVLRT